MQIKHEDAMKLHKKNSIKPVTNMKYYKTSILIRAPQWVNINFFLNFKKILRILENILSFLGLAVMPDPNDMSLMVMLDPRAMSLTTMSGLTNLGTKIYLNNNNNNNNN